MKMYSKGSTVRKPMMYGGGASMKKMMGGGMTGNMFGDSMAAGMKKNKPTMGMMGMKYGGKMKKK